MLVVVFVVMVVVVFVVVAGGRAGSWCFCWGSGVFE